MQLENTGSGIRDVNLRSAALTAQAQVDNKEQYCGVCLMMRRLVKLPDGIDNRDRAQNHLPGTSIGCLTGELDIAPANQRSELLC